MEINVGCVLFPEASGVFLREPHFRIQRSLTNPTALL